MSLEGLLEELHADSDVRITAIQALDDGKLVEVVVVTGVGLAHENDILGGELGNDTVQIRHSPQVQDPRRHVGGI